MYKQILHIIAFLLFTVVGMMLLIGLFGEMTFAVEALQFSISVQFSEHGWTQLEIPPLGVITAHTHITPVKIIVRLENIDLEQLKEFISSSPEQEKIINDVQMEARRILTLFTIKLLVLAVLGGAFGVFILRHKNIIPILKGAVTGLGIALVLLAGTYFTYDIRAFQNPRYEGVLRAAPWMINLAEEALGKIESLSQKMQVVATNLYDLYEQIDRLKPLEETEEDIKILHVSDLHNNPAGIEFVAGIARLFDVDLIIDTGDISDFGTPLETLLLDRLYTIDRPYIFIPGNHDSPDTVNHMQQISGVTVLDGMKEFQGLHIMGFPDPASFSSDIVPPDGNDIPEYVADIKEKLSLVPENVDIVALHNHNMGESLAGYAPVILFGHNHVLAIEEKDNSVLINAGTSGASGLRGLQSFNSPYSVVLLHFQPVAGQIKLVAADTIQINNLKQGFTLERKVFNRDQDEESPRDPT